MTALKHNPCVGIVADTKVLQHMVAATLRDFGYDVGLNVHPSKLQEVLAGPFYPVDVWLVELQHEDEFSDCLQFLIDATKSPILFGDGAPPSSLNEGLLQWQRRLFKKLEHLVGAPLAQAHGKVKLAYKLESPVASTDAKKVGSVRNIKTSSLIKGIKQSRLIGNNLSKTSDQADAVEQTVGLQSFKAVWVLGASLGGPAAVKEFLDYLPDNLPVAFIVAQHIDADYQPVLVKVLGRENNLRYSLAQPNTAQQLSSGSVLICDARRRFTLSQDGILKVIESFWESPYTPNIDEVLDIVAGAYRGASGAIIFTGMGADGAVGVKKMAGSGGTVWAQSQASCAQSSMPDAARAADCVTFSGAPKELSEKICQYYS